MPSRGSQVDALLEYLRNHPKGIDRDGAEKDLGICSLSRRVCDLKDLGYKITKKRKKVPTRYERPAYVVVYALEKKKADNKAEAPAAPVDDRSPDKDDRPVPAPSASPRRFGPPKARKKAQRRLF